MSPKQFGSVAQCETTLIGWIRTFSESEISFTYDTFFRCLAVSPLMAIMVLVLIFRCPLPSSYLFDSPRPCMGIFAQRLVSLMRWKLNFGKAGTGHICDGVRDLLGSCFFRYKQPAPALHWRSALALAVWFDQPISVGLSVEPRRYVWTFPERGRRVLKCNGQVLTSTRCLSHGYWACYKKRGEEVVRH